VQLELFDAAPPHVQSHRGRGREHDRDFDLFARLGYLDVIRRGEAGICGLLEMLFTGALVVDLKLDSYGGRYCYESLAEARVALIAWHGVGDPPGKWIKFKCATGERLGPGCFLYLPVCMLQPGKVRLDQRTARRMGRARGDDARWNAAASGAPGIRTVSGAPSLQRYLPVAETGRTTAPAALAPSCGGLLEKPVVAAVRFAVVS